MVGLGLAPSLLTWLGVPRSWSRLSYDETAWITGDLILVLLLVAT